jgi:hypothetical protein
MTMIPCRDCGQPVDLHSRGCTECARNLDAERMFDKLVLRGLLLLVIVAVTISALVYLRR